MDNTQKKEGIVIAILALLGLSFLWYRSTHRQTTKPNTNGGGTGTPTTSGETPTGGGNHLPSLPTQPQIIGSLENVQRDVISGWAANVNDFSKPLELDVYIDGVKKATTKVNMFRTDIKDMLISDYSVNPPNNQFGFEYHSIIPTGTHKIQVKVKDTDIELTNSPYVSNFVNEAIVVELPRNTGGVIVDNNPANNFYNGTSTTTDTPNVPTSGGRRNTFILD